jgi:hypothetical protein
MSAGGRTGRAPAVLLLALAAAAGGCDADPKARAGYEIVVPPAWPRWTGAAPVVPGETLEAYRVPAAAGAGSLVVFRSPYLPETTVAQLLVARRNLLLNLPSFEIREAREMEVAGKPALLFDVAGEGTGWALSATGLGKPIPPEGEKQFPTRRLWVTVPRGPELGTLEVFFHCPAAEFERLRPEWEGVLRSLRA